jgi:hypothetical protein
MGEPQTSFAAGMFWSIAPHLIPLDGARDIVGLLEEDGTVRQRGGATNRSTGPFGSSTGTISGIWYGRLPAHVRTVLYGADGDEEAGTLNDDGSITVHTASAIEPTRAVAYGGVLYLGSGLAYDGTTWTTTTVGTSPYLATVAGRLLRAASNKVEFTGIGTTTFDPTDFHELPDGVTINGLIGLRNAVAVFTTQGLYVISGLNNALTDADGNVQHRIDVYSRDVVLRHILGVAPWAGGLVVPALDGIWNVSLGVDSDALAPLAMFSEPINTLYRAATWIGQAVVHRGHYLLPIEIDGDGMTLACRLDHAKRPWSRLQGHAANVSALAVIDGQLVGAHRGPNGRVQNLGWFDRWDGVSVAATDTDGEVPRVELVSRDLQIGGLDFSTVTRIRLSYKLAGGVDAAIEGQASTVPADPALTSTQVGAPYSSLSPDAPANLDTGRLHTWSTAHRGRFARVRLESSGDVKEAVITGLELVVRSSGRR